MNGLPDRPRSRDRLRILLSEGSSTSARQALYALGRRYEIEMVDPSPWCQCNFSSLVRRRHRCPPLANDPVGYVTTVAKLLRRRHYDVLLPTHDQVYLFSKFRETLGQYAGLAVPPFESIRRLQSKADFARLFQELGLPMPETHVASSTPELSAQACYPCYVKLNHSTASHGVRLVEDRQQLRATLDQFQASGVWSEGEEIVVQKPAGGDLAVVNAVFQEGQLVASHCMEILATGIGGGPSLRVSAWHPAVAGHLQQLGIALDWHGPLILEYFYDRTTGQPQYIEANPRIGDSVNACLSGLNLCDLVVQISLGQRLDPRGQGRCGVKSHCGFILLLADAYNGATRRQLLRRLWRSWTRQGEYACENEITRPREDWASPITAAYTTLRLLALPRSAVRLSKGTVANYCLSHSAAATINQLDPAALLAELTTD